MGCTGKSNHEKDEKWENIWRSKRPAQHPWIDKTRFPADMTSLICVIPPALMITRGAMTRTPIISTVPCTNVAQVTAYNPPITVYAVTIAAPIRSASQWGGNQITTSERCLRPYNCQASWRRPQADAAYHWF
jgi:hypothetical protein